LQVYVHPREIDVDQPRMRLGVIAGFRYYVNLKSTVSKLNWLCKNHEFAPLGEIAARHMKNGRSMVWPPEADGTRTDSDT
jgi:hypothetical protein